MYLTEFSCLSGTQQSNQNGNEPRKKFTNPVNKSIRNWPFFKGEYTETKTVEITNTTLGISISRSDEATTTPSLEIPLRDVSYIKKNNEEKSIAIHLYNGGIETIEYMNDGFDFTHDFLEYVAYKNCEELYTSINKNPGETALKNIPEHHIFHMTKWYPLLLDQQGKKAEGLKAGHAAIKKLEEEFLDNQEPPTRAKTSNFIELNSLIQDWEEKKENYNSAYALSISRFHAANKDNKHKLEEMRNESYGKLIANIGNVDMSERQLILITDTLPPLHNNKMLIIKNNNYGALKFEDNMPENNMFYYSDPQDSMLYRRLDKIEEYAFMQSISAALKIIGDLCPSRITINAENIQDKQSLKNKIQKDQNNKVKINEIEISAAIASVNTSSKESIQAEDKSSSESTQQQKSNNRYSCEMIYDLKEVSRKPSYDKHTVIRADLQGICDRRINTGIAKESIKISSDSESVIKNFNLEAIINDFNGSNEIEVALRLKKLKFIEGKTNIKSNIENHMEKFEKITKTIKTTSKISCEYEIEYFKKDEIYEILAKKNMPIFSAEEKEQLLIKKINSFHSKMEDTNIDLLKRKAFEYGLENNIPNDKIKEIFLRYHKNTAIWPSAHRYQIEVAHYKKKLIGKDANIRIYLNEAFKEYGLTEELARLIESKVLAKKTWLELIIYFFFGKNKL